MRKFKFGQIIATIEGYAVQSDKIYWLFRYIRRSFFIQKTISCVNSRSFCKLPLRLKIPTLSVILHPLTVLCTFKNPSFFSIFDILYAKMASETGSSDSRNGEVSSFLPFILGLNLTRPLQDSASSSPESQNLDRIVLINPFIQGMVVIERTHRNGSSTDSSIGLDSLLWDIFSGKKEQPPASKESIEALQSVEIEKDGEECVICLEEWAVGEMATEMPCKHIFHGGCIEKWLKIHGSCPVCRYKMPVDEDDDSKGKSSEENDGERRRDIWMRLVFSSDRRSGERTGSSDSSYIHQEAENLS